MASDEEFASYACGQMRDVPGLSRRKMFGEYAVYVGDKVVALIADNQVFVKPTEAGKKLIGDPVMAPPYPGAKDCFLVDEYLDDADFMSKLIRATEKELPVPKPKKKKK